MAERLGRGRCAFAARSGMDRNSMAARPRTAARRGQESAAGIGRDSESQRLERNCQATMGRRKAHSWGSTARAARLIGATGAKRPYGKSLRTIFPASCPELVVARVPGGISLDLAAMGLLRRLSRCCGFRAQRATM